MEKEFIAKFDKMDINAKRNQISDELIIMSELIKKFQARYGLSPIFNVKNYDQNIDSKLDESQILTFFYEDIFNIQQELITLLSAIDKL